MLAFVTDVLELMTWELQRALGDTLVFSLISTD